MLHEGCAIQDLPGCGKGIVALRHLSMGEVLIEEAPLLAVDSDQMLPEVRALASRLIVDPMLFAVAIAFARASAEVQQAVQDLYCPAVDGREEDPYWRSVCTAAAAASRLGDLPGCASLRQLGEPVLRRVMLTWLQTNHSFRHRFSAVFETASRLNHSCDQNTQYLSHTETAAAQWVARRDIEAGEQVTTSYMMKEDAQPAPLRQAHLLKHYWFTCCCTTCTSGIDACAQLPCPRCYPAARDADGLIKSARKVGQLDKDAFTFTFHNVLEPHYLGCRMDRMAEGHPRPWVCTHCGVELEDSAEALFPAQLLQSRQWRDRPDLELTQMVINLERLVDKGVTQSWGMDKAFAVLDSMFNDALGVLGFKHYAIYRLVQMQAEFGTQKLRNFGYGSLEFAPTRMSLNQADAVAVVAEAQRKWAMLASMMLLLGRLHTADFLSFFSLKLQAAVHDLMPLAASRPAAAGADAVAAAQQLAAQLIRLQVRYYALEHPKADPGAEETLELLGQFTELLAAQQGRRRGAAARGLRLDEAGWRLLQRPLKLKGKSGSVEMKLFNNEDELATARAWLAQP